MSPLLFLYLIFPLARFAPQLFCMHVCERLSEGGEGVSLCVGLRDSRGWYSIVSGAVSLVIRCHLGRRRIPRCAVGDEGRCGQQQLHPLVWCLCARGGCFCGRSIASLVCCCSGAVTSFRFV